MLSPTPAASAVGAVKPKASRALRVSALQLRCFIMLYLSVLSVEGLPLATPIFSAIHDTAFVPQSGTLTGMTKRLPSFAATIRRNSACE